LQCNGKGKLLNSMSVPNKCFSMSSVAMNK